MSLVAEALTYATNGWRVIPVWWMGENGVCGCGNPYCTAPGKHPLVKMGRGLANASSDEKQIRNWWEQWPKANIAIACGRDSGFVVVDCDIKDEHDGMVEFLSWCSERGIDLPDTMTQETGSGGRHYLFSIPEDGGPYVKNATGWLEDVDIKSEGGYILVAPSVHHSGRSYRWLHTRGMQVAEAPPGLLAGLRTARSTARGGHGASGQDQPTYDYREAVRSGPKRGTRDHFFNSRAFELRKSGVTLEDAVKDMKRLHMLTEQSDADPFPFESVVEKLRRVWDEVEPDPQPEWDPFAERKPMASVLVEPPGARTYTDEGNAWRLVQEFGNVLRYSGAGGWFVWDGQRWAPDTKDAIWEYARETLDRMALEAVHESGEDRDELLAWVHQSRSRSRYESMIKLTRAFDDIKTDLTEFDSDPWLFNCPNGTINLRTGELKSHDQKDLITKMSPVEFHPGLYDERFNVYLSAALAGDAELMEYIQRAAGYTLTGDISENVFFIVFGPTASGKSTFLTAMQTVMGEYAMQTSPENLLMSRNGTPKDEVAAMRGARLVATSEPPPGSRFSESLIKQMTGGEKLSARHLYKDRFEFEPTHKIWMTTNSPPRTNDKALHRRMHHIPFPHTVEPQDRDLTLRERWLKVPTTEGAQAVLAWAVQGCLQWQQERLGTAAAVQASSHEYEENQDVLGQFVEDCFDVTPNVNDSLEMSEIYDVYRSWCSESGEMPLGRITLTRQINERSHDLHVRIVKAHRKTFLTNVVMRERAQAMTWSGGTG